MVGCVPDAPNQQMQDGAVEPHAAGLLGFTQIRIVLPITQEPFGRFQELLAKGFELGRTNAIDFK